MNLNPRLVNWLPHGPSPMREPETYCLGPDLHAWMRNGVMIESRGEGDRGNGKGMGWWGGEGVDRQERMQPLLSLGAYDIEQQRQSIRSNIQQAPAQWIVARGRRGGYAGGGCAEGGGGDCTSAIKSRACRIPLDNGINWIAIGRAVVSRYSITEAAIVFRGL